MDFDAGMERALQEARTALEEGETPVGAALYHEDSLVAAAHNRTAAEGDSPCHAELLVLREGCRKLGSLKDCTLYVTMEPCAMCAGAMVLMKLPRLVYGAADARCGCCGSRIDLTDHWFYHSVETWGLIRREECAALLTDFFSRKRRKNTTESEEI